MKIIEKEDIIKLLQELGYELEDWQLDQRNSFMIAELLMQIERQYNIFFEYGEWEEIVELEDLVALVNEKIANL